MDVVQNEKTAALFTPFVIKLKEICNTGRVSLPKRIKTNHQVKRTNHGTWNKSESFVA